MSPKKPSAEGRKRGRRAPLSMGESVCRQLRTQILAGQFTPGQKLPTFDLLQEQFGTSRAVVQYAITRLKSDGFINSVNRKGLYVSSAPPHLNRYALLFPSFPDTYLWSRFNTALVNEARRLEGLRSSFEISIYTGVGSRDQAFIDRLREDVKSHRFAGLLLMPDTFSLAREYPFNLPDIPKVFIFSDGQDYQVPSVSTDGDQFIQRSLQWIKSRNRRRLAIIRFARMISKLTLELVQQAGLECYPHWIQSVARGYPEAARQLVPLLMSYPPEQRPDALLITDDNLVEHVAAGLVDARVHVGTDLDIVAHCNWPWAIPSILPMQRIGFHAGDFLRRCIDVIDMQRRGEAPPAMQAVPALTEEEAANLSLGGDMTREQENAALGGKFSPDRD